MAAIDKRKAVQAALEYTRQRRFDKAIAEYQSALKADPQDLSIYKKLGDLYAQTGAVEEAIATYMKLGDLYRADNLVVKAIAIYKMVLNLDPRNMQIYLACADLYAEQGLIGEARIQYMTVADHYTRAGEIGKALEVFEKIARLDPTNFAVAAKLGALCEKEKLPDRAVANYVAAGQAAARAGQVQEARELFGRALRIKPEACEPHFGLAKLHFDAGAYGEAAAALERGGPGNGAAFFLLGQCHRRLGSLGRAREALRRAVEADPTAPEARLELARCLLEGGDAEGAHAEFAEAASQLTEEGRGEEALALLQDVCAAEPPPVSPLAKLAEVHRRLGHEEEAREVDRRLALLYEQRGDLAAAAAIYRAILEVLPDDPDCVARLEARGAAAAAGAAEPPESVGSQEVAPISAALLPEDETELRVIPITESAEGPGEEVSGLYEGAPAAGFLGADAEEPPPGADLMDDAADVAEQLAEADVYLKYGLVEKAVERLRETLSEVPQNLAARARLRKVFLDEGRIPEAVAEGLALADTLASRDQAERAIRELLAVQRLDPENREIHERFLQLRDGSAENVLSEPAPAPPVEPPIPSAPSPGAASIAAETPEAPEAPALWAWEPLTPAAPETSLSAPPTSPAAITQTSPAEVEPTGGLAEPPPGEFEAGSTLVPLNEEESAESPPLPYAEEALRLSLKDMWDEETEGALELEAPAPEAPLTLSAEGPQADLEAAELFRSQGMVAEAAARYRRVVAMDPGNSAALAGLAAMASGSPGTEGPPDAAPAAEEVVLDIPTGPEGPGGDVWILGPGSFPAEPSLDLELPPSLAPEAPEPFESGATFSDLDLSVAEPPEHPSAPPIDAAVSQDPSAALQAEPARPEEPCPSPPPESLVAPLPSPMLVPQEMEVTSGAAAPAPEAPPSRAPAPETSDAPSPPPAPAGPRRIGPDEEIPVFRVAAPTDAQAGASFVDLGAEIQKELGIEAEGAALLDAILGEFQRGVRENLEVDDYETHYNLGIAYKEMDLFEEAVEEFRLAGREPARRTTCSSLIALCFLRKGQAEQAIAELRYTLSLSGHAPEEVHALQYDLATAYEAAGHDDQGLEMLEALVAEAPSFRDAAARMALLQNRLRQGGAKGKGPFPAPRPGPFGPQVGEATDAAGQGRAGPPGTDLPPRPEPAAAGAGQDAPPGTPAPKSPRPRRDKISFV